MKTAELYKRIQEEPGSVTVKLTRIGQYCWDEGPDEGMVADVINFAPDTEDPECFVVLLDFSPYEEYNKKIAKKDWYKPHTDELGATWFTSGFYPENGMVEGHISARFDDEDDLDTFTIVPRPQKYILRPKRAETRVPDLPEMLDEFWKYIADTAEWSEEENHRCFQQMIFDTYVFPQTWGSTALGFDTPNTVGCCAMTTAETTVFYAKQMNMAAVFFGGRKAYIVIQPNEVFWDDVKKHNMVSVSNAKEKY